MAFQFRKPARPVTRVFIHCSASDRPEHDSWAVIDRWHRENGWAGIAYNYFIRQRDGVLEEGRDLEKTPAAQQGHNTATIAICLHGLDKGKFTEAQFRTLRGLCQEINAAYGGKVTFHGHCEVAAKACPVFIYRDVLGLSADGHLPMVLKVINAPDIPVDAHDFGDLEVLPILTRTLRQGDKSGMVRDLQVILTRIGYFTGAIDGDFGKRTRAAVLAFQADNYLVSDGIVGPLTREALGEATPREVAPARAMASLMDLSAGGSRIAKASIGNGAIGALIAGGGAVTVLDQLTGTISQITGQSEAIERLFNDHGLAAGLVILAAGAFVAWQSWRAGRARVEDHRSGKTS